MAFLNSRDRTTQAVILNKFAERLRQMPDMNQSTVVIDDQPIPLVFPPGGICICVAPGAGAFRIGSAHDRSWTEEATIVVGIYIVNRRDRAGRAESRILDKNTLLYWKRMVMSYLAIINPEQGESSQFWEPLVAAGADDKPILRSAPRPVQASAPGEVSRQEGWIGMQIYYQVEFDWDLYDIFE